MFLPWAELPGSKERKEARIEGLEPLCAQKKIHWQARHHELVTELLRYPRGAYRDAADALAYQPELAFRGSVPKAEPDPKDPFVSVQRSFTRLGIPSTAGGRVKNFWRDA